MENTENKVNINIRWMYLVCGTIALLFAGIIYAWSILKAPLAKEFGWGASQLALNFTFAMCFFCIGGVLGGILAKNIGVRLTMIIGGVIAGVGFILASTLTGNNIVFLYIFYGMMSGLGIGIAYNTIIASVNAWFPDRKGLSSGIMLMAFGASTLVLGKVADAFFALPTVGWKKTYMLLGCALGIIVIIAGLIIKRPGEDMPLPKAKEKKGKQVNDVEALELSTTSMIKRPTFWLAFIAILFLACTGNSIISFAKDMVMSVGAAAQTATLIVGIFSVCNGLGRIAFGAIFDALGCKKGMKISGVVTILAAAVCLVSVITHSFAICVIGLCLSGLSFSACPICATNFVSVFYGMKHFATNFSVINFNLILTSFITTLSNVIYTATGGYTMTFVFLLGLGVIAFVIILFIRKP